MTLYKNVSIPVQSRPLIVDGPTYNVVYLCQVLMLQDIVSVSVCFKALQIIYTGMYLLIINDIKRFYSA